MPQSQPLHNAKADLFRVLAHPARIRIIELLRDGARSVSDLQDHLEINSSGTSQHLGALRKQGVLEGRRSGTNVYYSVKDPRVFQLLETARQILSSHYKDAHALLSADSSGGPLDSSQPGVETGGASKGPT